MATQQRKPEVNNAVLPASETITRKARVAEGEEQSECNITIHWDDPKAERDFARRGVVIAVQAILRASGEIPAEFSTSVSDLAKRERGGFATKPTATNAKRMISKLDDADYAKALTDIGIGAAEVRRLIAARAKAATQPTPQPAPKKVVKK